MLDSFFCFQSSAGLPFQLLEHVLHHQSAFYSRQRRRQVVFFSHRFYALFPPSPDSCLSSRRLGGGGGGGRGFLPPPPPPPPPTLLFGPYGYVPLNRVWFSRSWVLHRVYNFTIKRLEQGVVLDWKPFKECQEQSTFAVPIFFAWIYISTILVWKLLNSVCNTKQIRVRK